MIPIVLMRRKIVLAVGVALVLAALLYTSGHLDTVRMALGQAHGVKYADKIKFRVDL